MITVRPGHVPGRFRVHIGRSGVAERGPVMATRYATITLVEGGTLRHALIIGAGNGRRGEMDLFISHDDGRNWIGTDEIASITYDACGSCGRAVVEEGTTVRGESWHLDCATAHNPHV